MSPPTPGGSACGTPPTGYAYDVDRFSFEFSQPLSWPLAALGVTPWTAHVDVGDDELASGSGPGRWSRRCRTSRVRRSQVPTCRSRCSARTSRSPTAASPSARRGTGGSASGSAVPCRARCRSASYPPGGDRHRGRPGAARAQLLERRPQGAPGDGDELRRVLESVPSAADRLAAVPATADEHGHGDGRRRHRRRSQRLRRGARPGRPPAPRARRRPMSRRRAVRRRADVPGRPRSPSTRPRPTCPRTPPPRRCRGSRRPPTRTARARLDPLTARPISRLTPGPAARPASCPPRRGAARARRGGAADLDRRPGHRGELVVGEAVDVPGGAVLGGEPRPEQQGIVGPQGEAGARVDEAAQRDVGQRGVHPECDVAGRAHLQADARSAMRARSAGPRPNAPVAQPVGVQRLERGPTWSGPSSSPLCGTAARPARAAMAKAAANSSVVPRRSSLESPKPTTCPGPSPALRAASRASVRASSGCRIRLAATTIATRSRSSRWPGAPRRGRSRARA